MGKHAWQCQAHSISVMDDRFIITFTEQWILFTVTLDSIVYETRRFKASFPMALHQFLSSAEPTQFLVLISSSLRSILILSSHLRLGLPKVPFPCRCTS